MDVFVSAINKTLWGGPMLLLLVGCGAYLTVRLKFFQLLRIRKWMGESLGSLFRKTEAAKKGISPYQALSTALASTVGSGNIVGVATAIATGGAGAVFWMWVSAFFGMATKYTEIYLAVKFRRQKGKEFYGGPMYYIESGLGKGYKWLSYLFAISGALACIGMGAMNQANSITAVISGKTPLPDIATGIILALVAASAINGGIRRVSHVTERLVPIMAVFYVGMALVIMILNPRDTALAVCAIFKAAFTPQAVYGGAGGVMASRAVRFGVARGVFSNEAGLGSSPMVHAAADAKSPRDQGFWGVFEVFMDTMVICTVTAIVILSGMEGAENLTGAELVGAAFSKHIGYFGESFVGISTILFALTTILGWSYYGENCVFYLTSGRESSKKVYRNIFAVAVVLGAVLNVESVWAISDMFNGMMMVPNLIAVLLLSDIVIKNK